MHAPASPSVLARARDKGKTAGENSVLTTDPEPQDDSPGRQGENWKWGLGELTLHFKGEVLWSSHKFHVSGFKSATVLFLLPLTTEVYLRTPYR